MIYTDELLKILLRSILAILVLILVTKMLGKKQISQLTLYDYIVGITIGSIAADSIISIEYHFVNGMVAILLIGIIAYSISFLVLKSGIAYDILNGKPSILMENGEFNYENLRKNKITITKFIEQSRLNGYYDINILDYVILETNGQMSFLPKAEHQVCSPKDFKNNLTTTKNQQTFCYNLIIDSVIQKDILLEIGKDEEWLRKELKKYKINDIKKIALVTLNQHKKLKIYKELL